MRKIAIVGTGIAGLSAAYFLNDHFDLTLFEQAPRIGGHTHTIHLQDGKTRFPVDTGFMVFNRQTYPNLNRFFELLNIDTVPTSMSFAVENRAEGIEWNGAGIHKLFSQRSNLFRPRFWRFLLTLNQFCVDAKRELHTGQLQGKTLTAYLAEKQYDQDFSEWFMRPMSAAIWSTAFERLDDFPVEMLVRFFENHGFLGLFGHYQWYTVKYGSEQYLKKLSPLLEDRIHCNQSVQSVESLAEGVRLHFSDRPAEDFDAVILASHADQSYKMLSQPTALEQALLSTWTYQANDTIVHSDTRVLGRHRATWASWNYLLDQQSNGHWDCTTHYWMNHLQPLPTKKAIIVSLNARI